MMLDFSLVPDEGFYCPSIIQQLIGHMYDELNVIATLIK